MIISVSRDFFFWGGGGEGGAGQIWGRYDGGAKMSQLITFSTTSLHCFFWGGGQTGGKNKGRNAHLGAATGERRTNNNMSKKEKNPEARHFSQPTTPCTLRYILSSFRPVTQRGC